jgi:oligoribonuclease
MKLNAKARLLQANEEHPLFMPERLIMLDCEMTGLDPKKDDVIQIAALKLEYVSGRYQVPADMNSEDAEFNIFLHTDLAPISEFARKYMVDVYRKANESRIDYKMARALLDEWLGPWRGKVSPCGDCVPTDILFLYMKDVIDLSHYDGDTPVDGSMHYEYFDMNAIKAVARQKVGRKFDRDVERLAGDHDALIDCRNQLTEMNAIIEVLLS